MSMQEQLNVAAHTTEQAALSTYESICGMVDISPVADEIKEGKPAPQLKSEDDKPVAEMAAKVFPDRKSVV